jgi:uncharacterized membrane protein
MAGLLQDLTMLAFALHIGGGTVGLFSGTVAALARKGSRLHRTAGKVFFVSMLVMAAFAIFLAIVRPGEIVNLVVGTFVIYLVVTAWLTAQRKDGGIGFPEKLALFVILCLCVPFGIMSYEVAMGLPLFFKSALPVTGPIRIAVFTFTAVFAIASFSDARVVLAGRITGAPRLARHLWRMSLALMLATGSAFTNGLPRLLPGHHHVPTALLFPQFIWLAFLIFWMIRVYLLARPKSGVPRRPVVQAPA